MILYLLLALAFFFVAYLYLTNSLNFSISSCMYLN